MIPLLAQASSPPSDSWSFQTHLPAGIPMWLVALLVVTAITLIVYLYRAQRRLASIWVILALLALRITVIGVVVVMMLQPAVMWTHVTRNPGTLWLVLDQSGSMSLRDPQSSPLEKLRWADALGMLPDSKRKSKPDLLYARLYALDHLLNTLRPAPSFDSATAAPENDHAEVAAFVLQMEDFHKRLVALADDVAADNQVSTQSSLAAKIRDTAVKISDGINGARISTTLNSASRCFAWEDLHARFRLDGSELATLADKLDKAYLAAHASDTVIQTALSRITGQSRAELASQLLTSDERRNGPLSQMLGQFRTHVIAFSDAPQNVGELDPGTRDQMIQSALIPTTHSTNITKALELVGEQLAPGEKANVLLVTDARNNGEGNPGNTAQLLARRGVHIFGLLIGTQELSLDAAVEQVDAPDWIFKDDTLEIAAGIRLDGISGKKATVQLLRGNTVIDTQVIVAKTNKDNQRVPFKDKPGEPGVYDYEVRVADIDGESNLANNHQSFRVAVKKDKLAALVIEDVPRWEDQYLVNYLGRDQRLKLQTVLFTPAHIERVIAPPPVKASPLSPEREAQILPSTREEWQAFDIIVLGDVAPEQLPPEQQQFLATAVRDRGATLIVIAGNRAMPARYADSPLAEILPVRLSSEWAAGDVRRHLSDGFRPGIAPQGANSVLSQLGLDSVTNTQAWSAMPPWYWHSELTHAKDAATVIWTINDANQPDAATATPEGARTRALLSSMTVGRGRVLYLASDQTWRLRQIQGDNLQERFWGQVIRWATGTTLPAGGRYVRFGAEPQHAPQGTPVTVTARIFHEDLTPYGGLTFNALASTKQGKVVDTVAMKESPGDPGTYHGTFAGLPAGDLEITVAGAEVQRLLDGDPTVVLRSVGVQIEPQLNREQINGDTYPQLLDNIAATGGGISLNGPYADILADLVPHTPIVRTSTHQIGMFTDPKSSATKIIHWLALGLFVLVLTLEWIVRKRAGMV